MLGETISATQAAEWGLIWRTVDDDELDAAVKNVTDILERSSPNAMTRIRSALAEASQNTFSEQLDLEHRHQSVLLPANMLEGAKAFIEKRDPRFSQKREK